MVRLSIPALLAFRDLAVSAVLTAIDAEGEGPDADARDQIVSALNEAYNNVVLHAYRGILGGRIDLSISVQAGEVEIQLSDRGRGFDPASVRGYALPDLPEDETGADVDLDTLPESGMGLFIIRSFMDEVTYTRGAGGKPNVLVLRKRWPATAEERVLSFPDSMHKKETSQSGWRMRSVAVPPELGVGAPGCHAASPAPSADASALRTAGSLKRK